MLPAAVAGSRFVKIGWNLKTSPGLLGNPPSDLNAITEINTLDGHERHNVRSADARVNAAVAIQVDQFTGASNGPQRRFTDRFTTAHKRDDGAIVIDIHLGIQHVRIRAGNEGVENGLDFGSVLALTEIGNALHNGLHIQNLAQNLQAHIRQLPHLKSITAGRGLPVLRRGTLLLRRPEGMGCRAPSCYNLRRRT